MEKKTDTQRIQEPTYSQEQLANRHQIIVESEQKYFPGVQQDAPLEVTTVYRAFVEDFRAAESLYIAKYMEITGTVIKVGPDIHNKPSMELSDRPGGECFALCVFPDETVYDRVSVGDNVVCGGNLPGIVEPYGMVYKKCRIIEKSQK